MSIIDQAPHMPGALGDNLAAPFDQVVARLHREFRGRYARSLIEDLVQICHTELSCSPRPALPELVERLARQRLNSGWASLLIEGE